MALTNEENDAEGTVVNVVYGGVSRDLRPKFKDLSRIALDRSICRDNGRLRTYVYTCDSEIAGADIRDVDFRRDVVDVVVVVAAAEGRSRRLEEAARGDRGGARRHIRFSGIVNETETWEARRVCGAHTVW